MFQGPRRKLLVRAGELETWLTERKYTPPARSLAKDLEEWDRKAEREFARFTTRPESPRRRG